MLLVHFNDLKADLPGSIRRIAAFLGIAPDEDTLARIIAHCGFDYMKSHAGQVAPQGEQVVRAKFTKGVILDRRLAPTAEQFAVADQARRSNICAPVKN